MEFKNNEKNDSEYNSTENLLKKDRTKSQATWETMEQILEEKPFTYEGKDPDYDQLRYEALKEKYKKITVFPILKGQKSQR